MLLKNNYNNYEKCIEPFAAKLYCSYTDDVYDVNDNVCTPKNGPNYTPTEKYPPIMSRVFSQVAARNVTLKPFSDLSNFINEEMIPGINNIYIFVPIVCFLLYFIFFK